uniref:Uncharacterized protein n=1 Tax=Arundo donax TaxID=35708 RepID=A0A0A8Y4Y9_ARUDO
MEPDHEGDYVPASNLYAAGEDWKRVVAVRLDMGMGVRKGTARCATSVSYVEVNGE